MIKRAVAVLGALAAVGAGAVSADAATERLPWRDCGDGVQCAGVEVPLDWARPQDKRKTTVGLGKLPAFDQSRKLGVLVANFGGPGPSVASLRHPEKFAELRQWFDVVAFDPRGFGDSKGVLCPTDGPVDVSVIVPTQAGYEKHIAANRAFGQGCADAMGQLTGKINSWQVAHDLEAIRVALGERKLSYFGNSYGTVYGQVYADLFGHNVKSMFLDSVADHTERDLYGWLEGQAGTTERNLHEVAKWCATTVDCALHGQDVLAVWDRVLASATRAPIPAGPNAAASAGSIVFTAGITGSRREQWPMFVKALAEADRGDGTLFVKQELGPEPREMAMMRIALCGDFAYRDDYDELKRVETKLRQGVAPRLGWSRVWVNAHMCGGLPNTGAFAPEPIHVNGLPPTLITSGSRDSATPVAGSRRIAAQLGGRYLPAEGFHALYLQGNKCVREHAHRYLTTGRLPAPTASC